MFEIIPNNTKIDFISKTKIFGAVSALFVLGSLVAWFAIGPNWGIDFQGGSDLILKFNSPVPAEKVREVAVEVFGDASVQSFGDSGTEYKIQTLQVSVVNAQTIDQVKVKLTEIGETTRLVWEPEQPDRLDVVFKESTEPAKIKAAVESLGVEGVEVEKLGVEGSERFVVRFQDLGTKVRTGFAAAFPEEFNPVDGIERLETVGPRVGEQLRSSGIFSIIVALFLILIYIAFRFDFRYAPGAVVALTHDVIIAAGVFVLIEHELNLSIIAALLTIVGYSLNDTIVVFDRIRENLTSEGDTDILAVVNRSINETLSRTFMTSLTTLLAVVSIFLFGGGLIKDFALALIVGIVVGTYSSVFVASPVMLAVHAYMRVRQKSRRATQA